MSLQSFALATALSVFSRPVLSITKPSHLLKLHQASAPSPSSACTGFDCVQRYVYQPDSHYDWEHVAEIAGRGENGVSWEGHVLKMTSQQWLGPGETSTKLWQHPLTIVAPSGAKRASAAWATLMTGGDQALQEETDFGSMEKDAEVQQAIHIATQTGSTVAVLGNIPHQSMVFSADPRHAPRKEDEIKAFSWRQFLDHPDRPEWPIEVPILKAVVRAMDTVTAFTNGTAEQFIAVGCSKRGMASVMAAAVDERVKAYAPCSVSINNYEVFKEQTHAQGEQAGGVAIQDYAENSITDYLGTPEFQMLMDEVDPFNYMERLKKPVIWMTAGRDDFYMPDHTKSWWNRLPTEQKLHVIDGNSQHAGKLTPKFLEAVETFVGSTIAGLPSPGVRWSIDNSSGAISATLTSPAAQPSSVRLWRATTCGSAGRRDFRLITLDKAEHCKACGLSLGPVCTKLTGGNYQSEALERAPGTEAWVATVEPPGKDQFTAFFIEFEFDGPTADSKPWQLATEISVVPLAYPFPDCQGEGCAIREKVL